MTRTVTALYDSRSEAETACERLTATVETCCAKIIDQNSVSGDGSGEDRSTLGSLYVADDDREAYGEGVRRGGFMLCAEVSSDEDADNIIGVLEQTSAVDMDQRQQDWRSEGWQPGTSPGGQSDNSGSAAWSDGGSGAMRNLGTRQADRGGSSVRSYVRDPGSDNSDLDAGHPDGTSDGSAFR